MDKTPKVKGYILGNDGEILDEWFRVEENADRIDFSDLELKLSFPLLIPREDVDYIPKYTKHHYFVWESGMAEAVSDAEEIAEDNGFDVYVLTLGEKVITGFNVKKKQISL